MTTYMGQQIPFGAMYANKMVATEQQFSGVLQDESVGITGDREGPYISGDGILLPHLFQWQYGTILNCHVCRCSHDDEICAHSAASSLHRGRKWLVWSTRV